MVRPASWVLWLGFVCATGCGWFATQTVPDPVVVQSEALGVQLDAPKTWTPRHEPELNRSLLFAGSEGDRDHAVIVQKLPPGRSWRDHADRFRDGQEHALDKIQSEAPHEIGGGGVRFETRRERKGKVVRKYVYYVEIDGAPYLVDMAAPAADFDGGLFQAVAKTLRPVE